ncbi:MAG TPA: type II secretory pathway protein [Legionella sp.]|nr:type II secretory pathway protein [Legionella sp.]
MQNKHLKHCGSALITALFIMTIVAIAATAMAARLQLDIYRTGMIFNRDKLYLAAEPITGWAMRQLSAKKLLFTAQDTAGTVAYFPDTLATIYPGVTIQGRLIDLQARFNLNNLNGKSFRFFFDALIALVSKNTDDTQRHLILEATSAWIHADLPEQEQSLHLDAYLKQTPPYYPAAQPMADVSELRLIQGVNAALYRALRPYVTALPEPTPININTATLTVLRCLGQGLDASQAHELLEARGTKGVFEMAGITPLLQKLAIPNGQVTLESQYFLSQATLSINDMHLTIYTLLKREKDQKKGTVRVMILGERVNTDL